MNGRKSENRYWPGTIVRFSCDEGYRLIGYEARRCREDGLWSWGVDPQCIKVVTYSLLLSGVFLGVILPTFAIVVLFVIIWRRDKRLEKNPPKLPPKTYKVNDNHISDRTQIITKDEKPKSSKSLTYSNKSYDIDDDFSDEEHNDVDREMDQSLGVIEELQTRRYSASLGSTKAEINAESRLTSSRSSTLV